MKIDCSMSDLLDLHKAWSWFVSICENHRLIGEVALEEGFWFEGTE
jgi:hypothetical protein